MEALNTHEELEREIEALELLRQSDPQHLGGFQSRAAERLRLRHDHAPQFMNDDFQNELALPGIESSPAVARGQAGNGCIARLFRTLREQLLWVGTSSRYRNRFGHWRGFVFSATSTG